MVRKLEGSEHHTDLHQGEIFSRVIPGISPLARKHRYIFRRISTNYACLCLISSHMIPTLSRGGEHGGGQGGSGMKKAAGIVLMMVFSVAATVAIAQPWQGWKECGGWCRDNGGGPGRMYDPAKAETVKGEVTAVEKIGGGRRMGPGIGLKLKTASGELVVHLGPQWYIEQQGEVPIKAGDAVEVKGVKASRGGQDFFLAGEVKKGGDVLKLRDESGVPLWAGWRRGSSAP